MSKDYAVMHVGIGSKRYKPGEELPPLTDEQWKRLREMGAIRSEHDPVELELDLADELASEGAPQEANPVGVSDDEASGKAADIFDEDEEQEEMPDINVMDGIDEGEGEKPKKRGRKAGKA